MSIPGTFARFPIYAVLFDGTIDDGPYPPLVPVPHEAQEPDATVPHGLDREVVPALPGLWYCLHLPNAFHELIETPTPGPPGRDILDLQHHIVLAPINAFDKERLGALPALGVPLLVVCPDELIDEATRRSEALGFALPPAAYSTLSNETLKEHWRAIATLLPAGETYLGLEPALTRRLDLAPTNLPRRWLYRQLGGGERHRSESDSDEQSVQDRAIYAALEPHALVGAIRRLESEAVDAGAAEKLLPDVIAEERHSRLRIPVATGLPGVAPGYVRRAYPRQLRDRVEPFPATDPADTWATTLHERRDALVERNAIEFLTTHRALARGGIGVTLPSVPREAFEILAQLESHMRATRPKGRTVWRLLDRLGAKTEHLWSDATVAAVARASTLTAFSNFPVGLLRLPGDTAPLSARVPITYRPILPLTRALQTELTYVPPIDLSKYVRVLVAECIPKEDSVGAMSRIAWHETVRVLTEAGDRLAVEMAETLSPRALREAIAKHRPDVLIISAHGVIPPKSNVAGLAVGNHLVLGPGLGPLPPVVLVSACHVAPRGAGTVSVADLLLREGAVAVLGTQVPVDVRHNAMLMGRFLINIAEVLAGRESHVNLLDVWHRVQTGNAVNDVLSGSKWLRNWASAPYGQDSAVIVEFMRSRSAGHLRTSDVYTDTEALLAEIADDLGVGDRVRSSIKDPGYVPESLFYTFAGSPERIYLRSLETMFGLKPGDGDRP